MGLCRCALSPLHYLFKQVDIFQRALPTSHRFIVLMVHITGMASEHQVRQYLAYWFQLGRKVVIQHHQRSVLPSPVIRGNSYSQEFEACWQEISARKTGDCYLEGTNQTIQELLTPGWDIHPCARCAMPVPCRSLGFSHDPQCPCTDLEGWPNLEVPLPRSPVNTTEKLTRIRDRLVAFANKPDDELPMPSSRSPDLRAPVEESPPSKNHLPQMYSEKLPALPAADPAHPPHSPEHTED